MMPNAEPPPVVSKVRSTDFDLRAPCDVQALCNRKRFVVTLSPDPPPGHDSTGSIEGAYLERLDAALESEDDTLEWKIVHEIQAFVQEICQPIFRELAPASDQLTKETLHSFLVPEAFMLQIVTLNGKAKAKAIKRDDAVAPSYQFKLQDVTNLCEELPMSYASQIEYLQAIQGTRILKVSVNGQVRCCKLAGLQYPDISRELQVLQQIEEVELDPSIKIPRLRGVVGLEEGGIIGFLMDHVETGPVSNLGHIQKDITPMPRARREQCARQAEGMVKALHEKDMVWGDAKAHNLLIDKEDDVWLIDLGGGWTEGWVDEEMRDSKEGDLQGLERIRAFLKL